MVTYPNDWQISELGEKCEITSSKRVFESEWTNSGIPFLRTRDIASFHAGIEQKDKLFISEKTYKEKIASSGEPSLGDLLVTGVGTIGLPYLVKSVPMYFKDGNILWLKRNETFVPEFLYRLFLSKDIIQQVGDNSGFTTVGTLTIKNAKKISVPVPSVPEQKLIAHTLSEFDEYIANLEDLIVKKKNIREGALEDLVTGKTRINGFNAKWQDVVFNQVIVPKARIGWQGLKKYEYLKSGYSYLIGGTDFKDGSISLDNISYVSQERYDMDSNIQVKANDVLVTKDGTIGKVAMVPSLEKPATLNSGVFVFRTKDQLLPVFLYRVLNSSVFKNFISVLSAGSTIKHLYQKDLKNFEFKIPIDKNEQQAIADVLTAMDTEIIELEKEKEKMEGIRAGAMDDLLTGRVRIKA